MTLKEVDDFLDKMNGCTKESDQLKFISSIIKRCTGSKIIWKLLLIYIDDLKILWKLLDKDLKINVGPKFVLQAMHPKAFDGSLI